MRLLNVAGRLTLEVATERGVDVADASEGRFGPDPQAVFDEWDEFVGWAASAGVLNGELNGGLDDVALDPACLRAPVPRPRQVFALALNYADHSAEAARELPTAPIVFTKFPSCVAGPFEDVHVPAGNVDYEVELVVVMGRTADRVPETDAWQYVAGLCAGQDISERELQFSAAIPQLSLAKSMPGFGPIGPALVTLDDLADPDDLALDCLLNGEVMQSSRTSMMIFSVPSIIAQISATCVMLPGDLIFTGTPAGVGARQNPPRFLRDGDVLVTRVEGIGELRNTMVGGGRPSQSGEHGQSGRGNIQ
ncbi:MAG TPA: fumarylacetoacetate hydrolase family protein [Nocardioides sp.]|uniref:fumarylacetoacetate hydrolase family protein n=1 Tax=uncultured Nocardioides sp. TaxID=198441 RepID=UPI000ECC5C95|nr:fumarylacetoacetate hydrolase family protein [uncultured Nocardioides sp.]HCB06219.1 fumarylacetoacetate hydrolase [Nocardioides sp.]HRD59620.1 fumarylacetoacetate hydrolase family protein [Nocardioides sp.]HRI94241.1 fumarylacetoacetate hydrolase family protein [Nocardioides sp.]HRK44306.1 fumarylacetoacetate hydrolase family protein [Nocardioides sp.]